MPDPPVTVSEARTVLLATRNEVPVEAPSRKFLPEMVSELASMARVPLKLAAETVSLPAESVTMRLSPSREAFPSSVTAEDPAIWSTSTPRRWVKRASVMFVSAPVIKRVSEPFPPSTELVVPVNCKEEVTLKRSPDPLPPSRVMFPVLVGSTVMESLPAPPMTVWIPVYWDWLPRVTAIGLVRARTEIPERFAKAWSVTSVPWLFGVVMLRVSAPAPMIVSSPYSSWFEVRLKTFEVSAKPLIKSA